MRPANALRLYAVRLRARWVQECLAVAGIAAGVALLFASQVSSSSLQSSVGELSRGVAGDAQLQLLARDPHGFAGSVLGSVRHIRGVRVAAPLLEVSANASGPRGGESIELIGAGPSLAALGGALVRRVALEPFGGVGAVVLPAPLSRRLGVSGFGEEVTLQIAGRTARAPLYQQLYERQIGPLVASPVALAPLSYAQELSGLEGRVSRILVAPVAGARARVSAALRRLAAGRLNVEPIDYDETLFANAYAASSRSTTLFAAISALVGFLFAFNATLLTVAQRRRLIADLRRDGYTPGTVIAVLLLDALALGVAACALGLALGEELSTHLLHASPAFLSLAFAVGSQHAVSWQSVATAVGGGMLAAIVAVLSPLRDILSRDPLAAVRAQREHAGVDRLGGYRALAGVACLGGATATLLIAPRASIPGMFLLVAALLLELPLALSATLALVRVVARALTGTVPHIAAMELSAARARAVAITATGAIAVFGSVAIEGAHGDLLAGLEGAAADSNAPADVWVAPRGAYDLLHTQPFEPVAQTGLERLAGVRSVSIYRSGLLDWGVRRVLVVAPAPDASPLIPADQIVRGDPRLAARRVRAGGWLILSRALAAEHDLRIGEAFTLPTPDPRSFRLAAIATNLGWAPGAIAMNGRDYASAWGSGDASALDVRLERGFPLRRALREITHALGRGSGLAAQSAAQHTERQRALSREALARLTQIATLIPIAAVLAMAAAMGALVWQRRPRLAKLKLEGLPRGELWATILLESVLLLGVGCVIGAAFGIYGQQLADHALASVVNFPVAYSLSLAAPARSLALVVAAALAILAVPGYVATSVPASLALQD